MLWPADFPYLHVFFTLLFQQVLLPVILSFCETNINSTFSHCFFGGSSELATYFSIPVVRLPPLNFDYSSTIVTNVKIFESSDILFSSVCFLVYYYIASCLHLLYAWFHSHFRELTKRSRCSLIRHQKNLCTVFHIFFFAISAMKQNFSYYQSLNVNERKVP